MAILTPSRYGLSPGFLGEVESSLSAKSFPVTAGPSSPAASGKVEIGKDKNVKIEVTIKTGHLAKPGMLTPVATTDALWF